MWPRNGTGLLGAEISESVFNRVVYICRGNFLGLSSSLALRQSVDIVVQVNRDADVEHRQNGWFKIEKTALDL